MSVKSYKNIKLILVFIQYKFYRKEYDDIKLVDELKWQIKQINDGHMKYLSFKFN